MTRFVFTAILAGLAALISLSLSLSQASAGKRYATPPPLVLSPDLSKPMMLQLRGTYGVRRKTSNRPAWRKQQRRKRIRASSRRTLKPASMRSGVRVRKKRQSRKKGASRRKFDPALLPTMVNYSSPHRPGTIIISTAERRLYLVTATGKARRYGVGVGKQGFQWSGTNKISRKAEWPSWHPPAEMIAREKAKGRHLPEYMAGGPNNPLGARAMYLGSTLYRIHGSNQPWSIGRAVSSGCIRMRNQDVVDLYERVKIGSKVVVL